MSGDDKKRESPDNRPPPTPVPSPDEDKQADLPPVQVKIVTAASVHQLSLAVGPQLAVSRDQGTDAGQG